MLRLEVAARTFRQFDPSQDRCVAKLSYSQSGEDLIVWFLLARMGITQPTYLDIGAHHPTNLSNTALFHLLGSRGINVEPNPDLISAFLKERPGDINLNVGIAGAPGQMSFYRMSDSSLGTFSFTEAHRMKAEEGFDILECMTLPVTTGRELLMLHSLVPHFVSIDVEGHDLDVLCSFDFDAHKPEVICVETLSFSMTGRGVKNSEIALFLSGYGYVPYADTHLNTIFADVQKLRSCGLWKSEDEV